MTGPREADLESPPATTSRRERVGAEERFAAEAAGVSSKPERGKMGEGKATLSLRRELGGVLARTARGARVPEPA